MLTRSNGKKYADALDDLQPAFKATALPSQSITGEPLEPPLVPDAAYNEEITQHISMMAHMKVLVNIARNM